MHKPPHSPPAPPDEQGNPLEAYFKANRQGPGIWKWQHYFEIFQRHFHGFVDQPVTVLEIGVYSGGSLGLWKSYFGDQCTVYGVDIEKDCEIYNDAGVKIFIGDQGDRHFWKSFKAQTPKLDIVIDDGSHRPEHQQLSFHELLPHLNPGGVYLCEDLHHTDNMFALYLHQLALNLNACHKWQDNPDTPERRLVTQTTDVQALINSIHFYPYVGVVECNRQKVTELVAPKRGSQWQPFFE